MRRNRRILVAICCSLLIHVVVGWWVELPPPPRATSVRLDVTLVPADLPVPSRPPESLPVDEINVEPTVPAKEPAASAIGADSQPSPEVAQQTVPENRVVLNLERPTDWDARVGTSTQPDSPAAAVSLPFNRRFEAMLAARVLAKERALTVAGRESARYGVSDEDYTRSGVHGTEVKWDGSCYTLVEAADVESGARWWAGTCTDTRQRPLFQTPVEYDGLGRVVVD